MLGGIGVLRDLPPDVDAVVSLCRVSDDDMRRDMPHVEIRLIDRTSHDENPHLDFVLLDAVRSIEELRGEGRTVLVHCVAAYSRTPTIGALYGARLRGCGSGRGGARRHGGAAGCLSEPGIPGGIAARQALARRSLMRVFFWPGAMLRRRPHRRR